ARLLLRHQQRETILFRERRPAGAQIVGSGGLAASMENDNKGGRPLRVDGHKGEHPESARIGSESRGFNERAAGAGLEVSPIIPEAMDSIQTSQEFDIVSEGHRQLLGERLVTAPRT